MTLDDVLDEIMERATYEISLDDGSYYGEIPNLVDVWASAPTLEACRRELRVAVDHWLYLRLTNHMTLPLDA